MEDGLSDARRELARVDALLDTEENQITMTTTRVTVAAADLAGALDAVRFAVGDNPDIPALSGVQFEVDASAVRFAATDRYRLAFAELAPSAIDGPAVSVLVPTSFVDGVRSQLDRDPRIDLVLGPDGVEAFAPGWRITAEPIDHDFPNYRSLVPVATGPGGQRVTVDAAALRQALAPGSAPTVVREHEGAVHPVAVLAVSGSGTVRISDEADWRSAPDRHVAVNREFLLQALDAAGGGQLVLDLDGPIRPLVVRAPADDRFFSLLMPIRY
ncbi:DNA polymerase III subunit beta [Solwaraspora sp. WMMD406]|uniref:DNA polymerase III subunit beta n=1 Tax=Solwaraspora sp. WMMD406 TaxID=3016095 RepID=UPI002416FAAC|nr:DNA polymerase III subunit beta [Solwaraspora sp. WMMD406]MDG4767934.1 DNA polymerase III subunit beta [Solwaraspora sp. WMMD406]